MKRLKQLVHEALMSELQTFHGTSANFDKFNHKKYLSSGAGSQSFGWGTYVTDDNAIATSYANMDDNSKEIFINGNRLNDEASLNNYVIKFLDKALKENCKIVYNLIFTSHSSWDSEKTLEIVARLSDEIMYGETKSKEEIESKFKNAMDFVNQPYWWENWNCWRPIMDICRYYLYSMNQVESGPRKKIVYEVDIPDNNGTNYIEWYEHFPKEFMKRIIEGFLRLNSKFINMMCKNSYPFATNLGNYLKMREHPNFPKIIDAIANEDNYHTFFATGSYTNERQSEGKDVYRTLQGYFGSQKAASLFLMQCGFDGITYPTGTRWAKPNGAKDEGRNYVIFDANKAKITQKSFL